jgi:hypothetical protein
MKADSKTVINAAAKRAVQGGIVGAAMAVLTHAGVYVAIDYWKFIPLQKGAHLGYEPITITIFALIGAVMGGIVGGWVKHMENQKKNRIFNRAISYDGKE